MLHLDQNHSSLSPPHSKSNLILSNSPRPDQHSLLSWSPPAARDDRSFYQPQPDQPTPDQQDATLYPDSDERPATQSSLEQDAADPPSSLGNTSVGNAEESKLSEPPSTSPAAATSPTSSLTPPPDSTSPTFSSVELPEGESSTQTKVESSEGEAEAVVKVEGNADVEKASRASTPLSELSSAPDADDPDGDKKGTGEDGSDANTTKDGDGAKSGRETADTVPSKLKDDIQPATNGHSRASQSRNPSPSHTVATAMAHQPQPKVARQAGSSSSSRAPSLSVATPEPALQSSTVGSQKLDPKVFTILEVNAELLKACIEFQARNIPISDPRAHQYASRLQTNLAWLAGAADDSRKLSHQNHLLPPMQPPPPVDFMSMDRLQSLYTELPVLFAKDLRRISMSAPGSGTPQPPSSISNGPLKRERPDDMVADGTSKRRDTGESKGSTPAPSTPQGTASPAQSAPSAMLPPATPPNPMPPPGLPGPSGISPSMPHPSMPMGMSQNMNEAQMAAARERARQMQLRHAMQQQGMGDGMRQISPGHGPSQPGMLNNVAGPSGMAHNPQAQMAALASMGPMAMQAIQILQNPSHQLVQYLIQSIPGFQSLPVQQQVQHLQKLQMVMQARQQQRAVSGQGGQLGGGMGSQGGPSMQNNSMLGGGMGISNGSPTRMSPTGQQGPMGGQMHGGFSMNNAASGNMGMESRIANQMANLTPAQQANLANLTPHQRQQLMLMQQQQQLMRGANANQNMMNTQMFNAAQQQRMSQQAGSSPHIGSPMLGGPADGNNFPPALRSNPSVPGIARSTRTPSDHAPSPMTPQLGQRASNSMQDQFNPAMMGGQRHMNNMSQLQQGGMGQMGGGNLGGGWPQTQQSPQQMNQGPAGFGMSPPGSAGGFGGMSGNTSSPANQQWNQGGQFSFSAGSPAGSQPDLQMSRQTSATPVPQQPPQMAQNSPMGDQAGLNDFELFNWSQ